MTELPASHTTALTSIAEQCLTRCPQALGLGRSDPTALFIYADSLRIRNPSFRMLIAAF